MPPTSPAAAHARTSGDDRQADRHQALDRLFEGSDDAFADVVQKSLGFVLAAQSG